jgi:hypothetical protein
MKLFWTNCDKISHNDIKLRIFETFIDAFEKFCSTINLNIGSLTVVDSRSNDFTFTLVFSYNNALSESKSVGYRLEIKPKTVDDFSVFVTSYRKGIETIDQFDVVDNNVNALIEHVSKTFSSISPLPKG